MAKDNPSPSILRDSLASSLSTARDFGEMMIPFTNKERGAARINASLRSFAKPGTWFAPMWAVVMGVISSPHSGWNFATLGRVALADDHGRAAALRVLAGHQRSLRSRRRSYQRTAAPHRSESARRAHDRHRGARPRRAGPFDCLRSRHVRSGISHSSGSSSRSSTARRRCGSKRSTAGSPTARARSRTKAWHGWRALRHSAT